MTAFDPRQRLERYETQEFRMPVRALFTRPPNKRPLNLLGG
jgi:hypothetical protein